MEAGKLIPIHFTVDGTRARLYINRALQPAPVLDDLKQGDSDGAIALWVGPGTVARFTAPKIDRTVTTL